MDQPKLKPSLEHIRAAAEAIAHALGEGEGEAVYAIIGRAACTLLGSTRETDNIDIVVPVGCTKATRLLLRNQPTHFTVEPRTLHTHFKSDPPVHINILAPPFLWKTRFDNTTPVIDVNGVKVLKPALVLNAICNSIANRRTNETRLADAADIKFCLKWCAENKAVPTATEVRKAHKEFVVWFVSGFGGPEYWTNAGYNWKRWSF